MSLFFPAVQERLQEIKKLSPREYELIEDFPVKEIDMSRYRETRQEEIRQEARKKWIRRELRRRHHDI
jgi:hypothetical protein